MNIYIFNVSIEIIINIPFFISLKINKYKRFRGFVNLILLNIDLILI